MGGGYKNNFQKIKKIKKFYRGVKLERKNIIYIYSFIQYIGDKKLNFST